MQGRHVQERGLCGVMKRTVEVSCIGANLPDAFDQALGGWFTQPDPPAEALKAAHEQGHHVYKFKLTLELVEEITCKPSESSPG